jgi:acetylornithine/succinyldiaminopimelate/putrescine aminotransferase
MVLPCGPSSMRFSPALTITAGQAAMAFGVFPEALAAVEKNA